MSTEEVQLERRLRCHRALLLLQPWRCVSLLPPAGWDAERLRHSNRGHLHQHQPHALSRLAGPICTGAAEAAWQREDATADLAAGTLMKRAAGGSCCRPWSSMLCTHPPPLQRTLPGTPASARGPAMAGSRWAYMAGTQHMLWTILAQQSRVELACPDHGGRWEP